MNDVIATFLEKGLQSLIIIIIAIVLHFVLRAAIKRLIGTTIKKSAGSGIGMASDKDKKNERKAKTLKAILTSLEKYVVIFMAALQVLQIYGIKTESILAVAGIGSVAIGFGAQGLVKDFITGLFILIEDQFGVGDVISVAGREGTVETIGMRTTCIRSLDGDIHIIPNSEIKIVTNMSRDFGRAIVDVGVPSDEDIERVLVILRDEMELAFKEINGLRGRPVISGVTALGDKSVTVRIVTESRTGERAAVEREIRRMVMNRFKQEGISPYGKAV